MRGLRLSPRKGEQDADHLKKELKDALLKLAIIKEEMRSKQRTTFNRASKVLDIEQPRVMFVDEQRKVYAVAFDKKRAPGYYAIAGTRRQLQNLRDFLEDDGYKQRTIKQFEGRE